MASRKWNGMMNRHLCRMVLAAVVVAASTLHAENQANDRTSGQRNVLSNASGGEVDGPRRFFVDIDRGDDGRDGLTPETSLASIQAGIDRSDNGDTVLVYPGRYAESIHVAGKDIVLTGLNPTDSSVVRSTIIDGFVSFRGWETSGCMLTGFKITGGIVGSGLWTGPRSSNHTHATISHCVLEDIMTGCGGVIQDCDGAISHCLIANISYRCRKAWPVPAITGCHGSVTHCTIVNANDGIEVLAGGTCRIENSILRGGTPIIVREGGTASVSYSNVEAGPESVFGPGAVNWGPGNMDADPRFANLGDQDTAADYHLKSQMGRWDVAARAWVRDAVTSPCIDAGNPDESTVSEVWPHGQRINMGAYGGTAEASLSLSALGSVLAQDDAGTVDTAKLFALVKVWVAQGFLCVDDLNHDGSVNFSDFVEAAAKWNSTGSTTKEPFELTLGKGAAWSEEQQGYDPNLPGYHLVGDIASVTLRARATELPDKLVLAIRNWPSETPMLENFTLAGPHVKLSGEPFKTGGFERYERSTPQAPWRFVSLIDAGQYFAFEIAGSEIRVTFLPRAIELLRDECTISWIDWYRR